MSMLSRHLLGLCRRPSLAAVLATRTQHYSAQSVPSAVELEYKPRRAMLYVPGNEEKKIRKLSALDVDCACLDCEDAVAHNRKVEARQTVTRMLDELDFGRTEPAVRINSVSSGLAAEDLRVILKAERLPPTFLLPKVDTMADIDWFAENLTKGMKLRSHPDKDEVGLFIYVESALGLLNLRTVLERAVDLAAAPNSFFHLDGIIFGSDDFCADIGATRTDNASELLYARQKIIVMAKLFRLQVMDLVHIAFKDTETLKRQAEEGAKMGFTGKQCVHPIQVPIVQQAYSPSEEKVKWAKELIKAFVDHHDSGQGAFTFRGSMIDMPSLLQAKNIVQMAQRIKSANNKARGRDT